MHLNILLLPLIPFLFSARVSAKCPDTRALTNPSFENGSPPTFPPPSPPPSRGWYIGSVSGSSTGIYSRPGSPPIPPDADGGGRRAFTAQLIPNPSSKGLSGIVLLQNMVLCAGNNYSVQVDFRFQSSDPDNNCRLTIDYPDYRAEGGRGSIETASSVVTAGTWYNTAGFFPAGTSTSGLLQIIFFCRYGVTNQITVDNVRVDKFNGNV